MYNGLKEPMKVSFGKDLFFNFGVTGKKKTGNFTGLYMDKDSDELERKIAFVKKFFTARKLVAVVMI